MGVSGEEVESKEEGHRGLRVTRVIRGVYIEWEEEWGRVV